MSLHTSPSTTPLRATSGQRLDTSLRRRAIESVAFVATWVTAGYLLGLSSNGYLLLGIPLTAAFQLGVRRRPLRELFAGGTTRFALDRKGAAMATVLAITPGYYAAQAFTAGDWTTFGWYLAAMAGALAAAFSLRASSLRATLRSAALPVAVGAVGMATVYGVVHVATGTPLPAMAALAALAKYTALYYPATFLLEEVAFRGAIDAHVHHDGDTRRWQSPCSCPPSGGCGTFRSPQAYPCHSWSSSSLSSMSQSGWGCRWRGAAPATWAVQRWRTPSSTPSATPPCSGSDAAHRAVRQRCPCITRSSGGRPRQDFSRADGVELFDVVEQQDADVLGCSRMVGVHGDGGEGHGESFGLGTVCFGESTMRPGWRVSSPSKCRYAARPGGTVGWCYTAASPNARTLPPWWTKRAREPVPFWWCWESPALARPPCCAI